MKWKGKKKYDYLLPENKKITKVTTYYEEVIMGFKFEFENGTYWDVGFVDHYDRETIQLGEKEVIVGFCAKSDRDD